jgi:cellulose synthase/poly-beta-1,6-N-acetylglucosamine synthase-like glycosyltransferase
MAGSVTVITPTIGGPELVDALISVAEQDYEGEVTHLVVVDGRQYLSKVAAAIEVSGVHPTLLVLPENTGANGWNGHRIYAAVSLLVNTEYVSFLDQDNWFKPNHLSSAISAMERNSVGLSFSLRSIYSKTKEYICDDNCESLGLWPTWNSNGGSYLIDTSAYVIRKDFLQTTSHYWMRPINADQFYTHVIRKLLGDKFVTTGFQTLCYRLGGSDNSVSAEFFIEGNKHQEAKYFCEPFPWLQLS